MNQVMKSEINVIYMNNYIYIILNFEKKEQNTFCIVAR